MKKYGTPESQGKCDFCGSEGVVMPVETDTMKVASISNKNSDGFKMLCSDCSGVPVSE